MAFYDTLTDLANRRLFCDRLEHAIEHAQRTDTFAALLYLDLDQFKRVNDTLGHEAGDELLREVARRLSDCVRAEDTVARPGGDEFTVLLYDIVRPGDAGTVAEKILERLRAPITISGHSPRGYHQHRHHDHADRLGAPEHPDQERRPRDVPRKRARPQQLSVFRRGDEHRRRAVCAPKTNCARRSRRTSSSCSTSRRCGSSTIASPASRRCCAGSIRSEACSHPTSSSPSRKKPVSSSTSARGSSNEACNAARA